MPYKGGVQLLPETQRRPTLASYTSGNTYFYTGVAIGIAIIIIGAILGSYKANLKDSIASLDGQLQATEDSRDKDQETTLLNVAKQSKITKSLLANKLYWSQALGYVEQMTQSQVRLISMDADASKGTIGFHATADTYASVARQLAAFVAGTGVDDMAINSMQTTPQGVVEFSGTLQINTKTMLNK